MTEELENALRRTLREAAERAPKAPPGTGLEPRASRTPRGHSRMALTAAAVALAIGGATAGGRALLNGSNGIPATAHATAAPSPPLHRPKKTKVPPIEKVWPGVAFRVPNTLPNGRVFHPQEIIDDHTIAVTTESGFEKTDAVYAYDLRSHQARRITTVVTPPKAKLFAGEFTVGSGHVAWWLNDGTRTEIWAAPLAGGPAKLVGQADSRGLSRLVIDGKDAVWSPDPVGGVYRAPLTGGGTARMVPGSVSMHILDWPWIGSPPTTLPRSGRIADSFATTGGFAHVKNVVTGETRSAHLTDRALWQCGPTWCVGYGPNFVTEVQRRDGGGRQAIPWDVNGPGVRPPLLDRFVITEPSGGTIAVYDLRTGRMGDLGITHGKTAGMAGNPARHLYVTGSDGGYVIVDLGAIR